MKLWSWGRYPRIESEVSYPNGSWDVAEQIQQANGGNLIARGLGRSYGDSALAPSVIDMTRLDHLHSFDPDSGVVTCAAGVTIEQLLSVFVPKGWFLPVTPGTKYVTVGGAVASDVHGKNHHLDGAFSDHVISLKIATVSGGILECSQSTNSDLFHATCGGMGLTGVIVEATFKLRPIASSDIDEVTVRARNLDELFDHIEASEEASYSVAWVDCLKTGQSLGRSLLMTGEHSEDGELVAGSRPSLTVPVDMPNFLLNRYSVAVFNSLYYRRTMGRRAERRIHFEPFFYPLDALRGWNRLYGGRGFTQYQFVLPRHSGREGMFVILKLIAETKRASFLAVLKGFGQQNRNHISFPMKGFTLALDFQISDGLFEFLDKLDQIVLGFGGRVYLSKDVRMSATTFRQSYPRWEEFRAVRERYGAVGVFNSMQSRRLEL